MVRNPATGGTKEFKPVKLVDLVEPIVNGQDPSGDPFIKLATVDLTDVRDSNNYTTDEILIYDSTDGFINGNIINYCYQHPWWQQT